MSQSAALAAPSTSNITKTLDELYGVGGGISIPIREASIMTPAVSQHYKFREDLVQAATIWINTSIRKNLLLTGPTAAGKSSFIEEFCGRIGVPVWRIGCHLDMEFSDLVGSWRLRRNEKGDVEQVFVEGALLCAMRFGGVLCLDEGNFLRPGVVGALNGVLDGDPFFVPETGEYVTPDPRFRIAFTGNAVSGDDDAVGYRGIMKMNVAFLDRFIKAKVGYLDPLDEAQIVHTAAPKLPAQIIDLMIKVANDVRKQFLRGDMSTVISTRGLLAWAQGSALFGRSLAEAMKSKKEEAIAEALFMPLGLATTNAASVAEEKAIQAMVKAYIGPNLFK